MNLTEMRPLFAAPLKDFALPRDNAIADRYLNLGYIEIFESHRWANRKKTGSLSLLPNLTGTCSVTTFDGTNESAAKTATISIAGSDALLGRYFRVEGSNHWHKIVAYSGSTIYLDSPVIDGTGTNFEIWKRFYYLKSDADVLYDFDNWSDDRLKYISEAGLVDSVSDTTLPGHVQTYSPFGVDPYDDVQYVTGTITGSKDSNVIAGAGTGWLSSGFDTGDILESNNKEFYIKRVENDGRIILFNSLIDDIAAASAYKLKKNNPYGFQFYQPTETFKVIPYTYLSRAFPLIHPDLDKIQLLRRFIPAIVSRAIYFRMRDTDDNRMTVMLQIYEAELTGLKSKVEILSPRYDIFGPKIPSFMPGRG